MRCSVPPTGNAAVQAGTAQSSVPVLETARLILRAPRMDDLPLWTAGWQSHDPDETEQSLFEGFCVYVAGWMLHGHGVWTVEQRKTGETVGFLQLGLEWEDQEPEIGWVILPEHRRKGYASEAAAAVRDHAADLLGSGSAVSYIDPKNAASAAVAKRIGGLRDKAAEAALGEDTHVWRHGATQ